MKDEYCKKLTCVTINSSNASKNLTHSLSNGFSLLWGGSTGKISGETKGPSVAGDEPTSTELESYKSLLDLSSPQLADFVCFLLLALLLPEDETDSALRSNL